MKRPLCGCCGAMAAAIVILLFLAPHHRATFGLHVGSSFTTVGEVALRRRALSAATAAGGSEDSQAKARRNSAMQASASRALLDRPQTCPGEIVSAEHRAQTGGLAVRNPMPQELSPPPYSEYYDYSYEYYDYYEDADGDNDLDPWGFTSGQSVGAGNMGAGMGSMAPQHGHMCPDVGYTLARGVIMSALHADSTVECHSRCLSERACVSWSWVDPQRAVDRDDLGMCYLKYECDLSTLHFTDNGLWDGWPGCQVRDSGLADVFHGWVCPGAGYEYVGGTYNTFRTSSSCGCQALCAEQTQCLAWTWYAEADSICNLKNGIFTLEAVASQDIHAGTRNCTW